MNTRSKHNNFSMLPVLSFSMILTFFSLRANSSNDLLSTFIVPTDKSRYIMIDKCGKPVCDRYFSSALLYNTDGLFGVKIDSKWGFINNKCIMAIPATFDLVTEFHERFAVVKFGDKFGYIDTTGKPMIASQFDLAMQFSEGLAGVGINKLKGYIGKDGKYLIHPDNYKYIGSFSDGIAFLTDGKGSTFAINKSGKTIFTIDGKILNFSHGLAPIMDKNKLFGYVDKNGKIAIKPQFEYAYPFSEGLALVKSGNKYGYIDLDGNVVISPRYIDATGFVEGMAKVKIDKKWSFQNKKGDVIAPYIFDKALDFCEGMAPVKIEDSWGYINTEGHIAINPKFEAVGNFNHGSAIVKEKSQKIKKTGDTPKKQL